MQRLSSRRIGPSIHLANLQYEKTAANNAAHLFEAACGQKAASASFLPSLAPEAGDSLPLH
jgi:hypothetical protein